MGGRLRVRPFGIDLPERPRLDSRGRLTAPSQPYGDAAAACLAGLVQGRRVRLEIYGIHRTRRVLGTLFRESDNLNLILVEAGLAEVARRQHAAGAPPPTSSPSRAMTDLRVRNRPASMR